MKKTVLITGASSGIGYSTACLLAANNYRVVAVARNMQKLDELQREFPDRVKVFVLDVTDYAAVHDLHQKLSDSDMLPDILVNNAGMGYFERIDQGSIEHWHRMVDVNIKGMMNGIHVFLPHLSGVRGLMINLGSVASHQVFPNSVMYAATKHAVKAICDGIRLELAGKVRVTMISPGAVNTPFIDTTTNPEMLADYKAYFASAMNPDAVAQQILHCVEAPENTVISEIIIRPDRPVR